MTDNEVIQIFRPLIISGLSDSGMSNVAVVQSNQPTQQGVLTSPVAYFYKAFNKRYGWVRRDDEWDADTSTMVHTETQWVEAHYRMQVLATQDPSDIALPTASDISNEIAAILQSSVVIQTLISEGIGVLRISDISNHYFSNDKDQFEAIPSFDFVLTYEQTRVTSSNVISDYGTAVYPI